MSKKFPTSVLPPLLRQFVHEAAESLNCDDSLVALPALTALASIIGTTRVVRLKSGWNEPCVVWTGVVAEPGSAKSPALHIATKPLFELQSDPPASLAKVKAREPVPAPIFGFDEYHDEIIEDSTIQNKVSDSGQRQFVSSDVSVTELGQILTRNPRGILVCREELAGWVKAFDQRVNSDFWLSAHSAGSIYVDRSNGPSTHVRRAAVSITGGFQPGTLLEVLLNKKHCESGLAARFLFSFPPKTPRVWTDKVLRTEIEGRYAGLFLKLLELRHSEVAADPNEPVIMRLMPEARELFVGFFNQLGSEIPSLDSHLAAAWPKLQAYTGRLSLVLELAHWAEHDFERQPAYITPKSMLAAIDLVAWFTEQARHIYTSLASGSDWPVDKILQTVLRHGGVLTANELRQSNRSFNDQTEAENALSDLVKRGFGYWKNVPPTFRGGRPTRKFVLLSTEPPGSPKNSDVS